MKKLVLYLVLAVLCALSTPVMATVTYGFCNIRNFNAVNGAIGAEQFFVEVSDAGINIEGYSQVLFKFVNREPTSTLSSICDIYFDDGALLGISYLIDRDDAEGLPGVDFSEIHPVPFTLPTGWADADLDPEFVATQGFAVDADNGSSHYLGIDPGEWLGIVINLKTYDDEPDKTFLDVINDLATGELRIGIRAFFEIPIVNSDGVEQYVNCPRPIPAPGAVFLGGMGVVFVGWMKRRRTL